jgi:nitrogen fixation/metabolism regulation signal transduction histidine kinase
VPSEVNGDATRLRQVIHNLLQNAQDALQGIAQPQITLHTENRNREIHLWVEDNGVGFPESVLSRAFEPYMTTKAKGTGLGLAIVKKIVEEHGGRIAIENNVGGGARISIKLPLIEEA